MASDSDEQHPTPPEPSFEEPDKDERPATLDDRKPLAETLGGDQVDGVNINLQLSSHAQSDGEESQPFHEREVERRSSSRKAHSESSESRPGAQIDSQAASSVSGEKKSVHESGIEGHRHSQEASSASGENQPVEENTIEECGDSQTAREDSEERQSAQESEVEGHSDSEATGSESEDSETEGNEGPDTASSTEEHPDYEPRHNPFDNPDSYHNPGDLDNVEHGTSAQKMWEQQKKNHDEENQALDQLMDLVGLEIAKEEFLKIKATINAARHRRGWLRRLDLNIVFLGNPGTGKTTLANLYKDFLVKCGVWGDGSNFKSETESGYKLQKLDEIENLESRLTSWSGVQFLCIDDVDQTDSDCQGALLRVLDRHARNLVVVMTGSVIGTTRFLGSLPHGRWQCWRRLKLDDYDDDQFRLIFLRLLHQNRLQVEGGPETPYPRIIAKRVGRGRETAGFGNVHDLRLAFAQIIERQAYRLEKEKAEVTSESVDETVTNSEETDPAEATDPSAVSSNGDQDEETIAHDKNKEQEAQPPDSILTKEDMMGPEPVDIRPGSAAWKELQSMSGLGEVKKAIGALMQRSISNYRRELGGKEPLKTSLNRVFLGPPGTGKTTVAKLYGQILAELGLLSTKDMVFTTPGDYIGQYIGETEARTSAILDSTVGKVLIIDDAHTFYHGRETDEYRLSCIDVLVSRIHNRPGEDRCVILIGYPREMEDMFQKCNPGLKRRFPLEEAFRFDDYDDKRLGEILEIKMDKEEIKAGEKAMSVAAEVLRRARDRPNFGNGGEVDNLLNQAKARFRDRIRRGKMKKVKSLEGEKGDGGVDIHGDHDDIDDDESPLVTLAPEDFDPDWNRGLEADCSSLFKGLLGFGKVIEQFQGYQNMAANMRRRGRDPREVIPFTFVFKGPPGTGKTHTARIIGNIFYRMGFLSTHEVIECSASHLIGEYMGHTAPKVVDLFDRGLGKVLFIDEAYRLGRGGGGGGSGRRSYEDEAVGELVDCMTKPRYLRKMVIVLAGYERDMNQLLRSNAGLRGRFPTEVYFNSMEPRDSLEHLKERLHAQGIGIQAYEKPEKTEIDTVFRLFGKLAKTDGWSNGRDVQSLAGAITAQVYQNASAPGNGSGMGEDVALPDLSISFDELIKALKNMFRERIKGRGVMK
ncbi:hypothetical protein CEP51_007278 [Fusarium floridanum]|uniref:AAA+ ATPase domain-containing protein n=1 Tax=Fusarium floridanum TaxID=1325733 RepID=A0A428RQ07_9HYPO|nr:hypothetical protein CEP51_007278 [Fusarium floridanum]